MTNVSHFYIITFRSKCAVSNLAVFVVPWFRAFPLRFSSSIWVILRWFQLPVITGIIFVFTFHKRCISSVGFHSLKPFRLLYWSHFCLLKLQCLLRGTVPPVIADCDVQFIVRDGSVCFHLLIPKHVYFHDFLWPCRCSLSNNTPVPCECLSVVASTLCHFIYCSFAKLGTLIMWCTVST
jgi:hypothetical protein